VITRKVMHARTIIDTKKINAKYKNTANTGTCGLGYVWWEFFVKVKGLAAV